MLCLERWSVRMAPLVGCRDHETLLSALLQAPQFLKKNCRSAATAPWLHSAAPDHFLCCSAPYAMSPSTSPVAEVKAGEPYACAPIQCGRRQEGEAFTPRPHRVLTICMPGSISIHIVSSSVNDQNNVYYITRNILTKETQRSYTREHKRRL
jgi:hypothetical protein